MNTLSTMKHYWKYHQIRMENYKIRNIPTSTYRILGSTILLILFYLVIKYYTAPLYPLQVPVVSYLPAGPAMVRCAQFKIQGIQTGGGMGNVIFELMAMLGIAASSRRIPYIDDYKTNTNAMKVLDQFPKLLQYIKDVQQGAICLTPEEQFKYNTKCCTYMNTTQQLIESKSTTITVDGAYLQSYKYFEPITKIMRNLLQAKEEVVSIAKQELFPGISNASFPKICVHIRRGDFVKVTNVLASRMDFTRASIEYVRGNNNSSPVYIMSNDQEWSKRILSGLQNVFFAATNKNWPPNVEWEFSRLYCDKVILTASASTYGWWMGYLSKGQEVFYNGKYSTPGGIEKELNPKDFFPAQWKQIDLQENGAIAISN